MILTHSLFNSENWFPKNGLSSLKIFNFLICDFRNLLHHIKWLVEQFGNELNDFKWLFLRCVIRFCSLIHVLFSLLQPLQVSICLFVSPGRQSGMVPTHSIVSLIRKIGFLKMGFKVWKFSTSPFVTLEISYIILNGFKSNLETNWMNSNKLHNCSECNFFDRLQFFFKLLGTI